MKKLYKAPEVVSDIFLPASLLCGSLDESIVGGLEGYEFDPIG